MNDLEKFILSDKADNISGSLEFTPRDNSADIALQREAEAIARGIEQTRITEIKQSLVSKWEMSEKPERPLAQLTVETLDVKWKKVYIKYVPKEKLAPAFWYCYEDWYIEVRDDLPPRVKKFVRSHELYHHSDTSEWWWWIWREVRANLFPGLKDPIWLLATIYATLTTKERIDFYFDRIKGKY